MRWWLAAGVAVVLATGSAVAAPIDEDLAGDDYVEDEDDARVDDYWKDYAQPSKTVPQSWLFSRLSPFVDPDIYQLDAADEDLSVMKRDAMKSPPRVGKKGDRTNFRLRRKRGEASSDGHYAWRFKRDPQDNHEYFRLK